ncbi:hypothetical protein N8787_01930 [Opitutaceae bacterium]|nr:hypothetical protein [Opitutaceae bacterium]
MASKGKDNSDFERLNAQQPKRAESTDPTQQAAEIGGGLSNEQAKTEGEESILKMGEPAGGEDELESEILDALNEREEESEKGAHQRAVDEQLIANLGSGKNDYGVLEALIPQLDFDTIPLTRPKRVLAKSDPNANGGPLEVEENSDKPPSRALKRKKKPTSLLDSYFKGM